MFLHHCFHSIHLSIKQYPNVSTTRDISFDPRLERLSIMID